MDYNNLINILGFKPEEGTEGVYVKAYPQVENYRLRINTKNKAIDYGPDVTIGMSSALNFSQKENWVVLECVDRLFSKGYRPSSLTLEKTFPSGHGTSGRLDILVAREDGTAFLMIECKTFGKEYTKELSKIYKNGGQLFTYFQQDKNADILMLYASTISGNKVEYINEIINIEEDYRQTANVSDFFDRWNKLAKQNGIFESWVTTYDFQSKALTPPDLKEIEAEDSSFIFNQFLEILRHNVVSDKPNAFNKIFTLFLCKIFDEKNTRDTEELAFQWFYGPFTYDGIHYEKDDHISFQKRLTDLYKKGMNAFLDKEVTDISDAEFDRQYSNLEPSVRDAIKHTFTEIRLKKNNEFAIKEVFNDDSFLENAKVVKEVVELLQSFKIRYTKKQQYLSDFFELLLTTGLKQESGQFFTPVPIAQYIIKSLPLDLMVKDKLANGNKGDESLLPYVIDYAAGSGHFITEGMHEIQGIIDKEDPKDYHGDTAKRIKHWKDDHFDWAYTYIYGIEKDYRLVKVGKVGCYLHGDGLANIVHSDGLGRFTRTKEYAGKLKKSAKDFPRDNNQFDIVISNPPYSVSSFRNNARKYYDEQDFSLYDRLTDNSSEIECLFIERTKQLLSEGGLAGIILPSSMLSNTGIYTKTREIIFDYFEIVAITELGGNTFMATNTNTVVLFLRKRDNYFAPNLKVKVNKLWKDGSNVTINGVENALQKYIDYVWEGLTLDDYKSLVATYPSEAVKEHELYQDYQKKIKGKTAAEKHIKMHEVEIEKFFYFVLTFNQHVVITKTGEKKAEKAFLGYEFSNRRGNEGIHPIQRGRSIDDCTSLFDPATFTNPEKASFYVYEAYKGNYDLDINEDLTKNIAYANLLDLLTFDRPEFEKSVKLAVKKKLTLESKYSLLKITNLLKVSRGASPRPIKEYVTDDPNGVNWIKIGDVAPESKYIESTNEKITQAGSLKSRIVKPGDFILSNSMSYGRPYILKIEGCIHDGWILLSEFDKRLNKDFLYEILSSSFVQDQFHYLADGGTSVDNLNIGKVESVSIPLPPIEVQIKIVKEISKVEQVEDELVEIVGSKELQIKELFGPYKRNTLTKLARVTSMIKRGKSPKYGYSDIRIIKSGQARGYREFDFSEKHFVIPSFTLDERQLQKGDILINSSGVGTAGRVTLFDLDGVFVVDSHVSIIRINQSKALPTFVLYALADIGFKTIEAMATGQSGQIELSPDTIANIKIPLPSLSDQEALVRKIELIELEIAKLKNDLLEIPHRKTQIMDKYLK